MKILTSSYTLDLAGVPTFTLTMYNELIKQGHTVAVYSPLGGNLENQMKTIKNINELSTPDIILAQHTPCAEDLRLAFPRIPMLFYSHGLLPEIEQPPKAPVNYYLAINEEVQANLENKGIPPSKISIVRDFIDTDRFVPTKPLHSKLVQALFISNYKKWRNYQTVSAACAKLEVKLVCCGSPYGRSHNIEKVINESDLVISWGRGILEAMSCGRAVLSFDKTEGDGYITPETYLEARKNNFSGRIYKYAFTPDTLATEILKYNSGCSNINRGLILKHHNVKTGVNQIYEHLTAYCSKI